MLNWKTVMAKELKKYTVNLFDEQYTIVSDDPEQDVYQSVDYLNQCMEILAEESNLKDAKKLALLTGLQLSQELLRMQRMLMENESKNEVVESLVQKIDSVST